eukprot:scaffold12087_cov59-Cyclotella_meneghiniana.AAC.1
MSVRAEFWREWSGREVGGGAPAWPKKARNVTVAAAMGDREARRCRHGVSMMVLRRWAGGGGGGGGGGASGAAKRWDGDGGTNMGFAAAADGIRAMRQHCGDPRCVV